jgi:hypothetical protein
MLQMRKNIFLIILGLCSSIKIQAQDMFLGYWSNENRNQIIKIYSRYIRIGSFALSGHVFHDKLYQMKRSIIIYLKHN